MRKARTAFFSLLLLLVMLTTMMGAQAATPIDYNVTTPRNFFGYDIGQDYKLTPWQTKTIPGEGLRKGIVEYAHELERTSERVRVFEEGKTEEGRPMILTVITSKENWAQIDNLKGIVQKLADPRQVANDDEARFLAQQGKAIYWLSAAIHASERTSPEVLLRLGYDLASSNDDWTLSTLNNVVIVLENTINPDGLELVTDWYYKYKDTPYVSSNPPYYNKYISHDNNRDFLGAGIVETQYNIAARQQWQPTVYHDLHEAKDMLYMSPGTDPTNEAVNPLTMAEWTAFAGHNLSQLAASGWKGAFTYDYADMWYPGYNHGYSFMHNTNGRFYELQGAYKATPRTFTVGAPPARPPHTARTWYDPAPYTLPFTWRLVDAVNFEEDAIKNDLTYAANNKEQLLLNFYLKAKTNMQKATGEPPYAFVIPQNGGNNPNVVDMINNLHVVQKIEIGRAGTDFAVGGQQFQAGDYVVRMDQPYGLTAKNLLSTQSYPQVVLPDGTIKQPYDVTAWTYGLMRNVRVVPLNSPLPAGLSLVPVTDAVPYAGTLAGGQSDLYAIEHQANNNLAVLLPKLWQTPNFVVSQVDQPFSAAGHAFPAGTILVHSDGSQASHDLLSVWVQKLGLVGYSVPDLKTVATRLKEPKLGLYTPNNSNSATMPEGWTRLRLDRAGWEYSRLYPANVANDSLDDFDVIVIPSMSTQTLLNGSSSSATTPPEYRPGIGTAGVARLQDFVRQGGTLVLQGAVSALAVDNSWGISVTVPSTALQALAAQPSPDEELPDFGGPEPSPQVAGQAANSPDAALNCPGSILRLQVDPATRVGYGYDGEEAVWCESGTPYFQVLPGSTAQVVASYPQDGALLLSGFISGDAALRGKAAIVDAPMGRGHVILLAPNVLYRAQSTGTYAFFWNSLFEGSRAGGIGEHSRHLPIVGPAAGGAK